MIGSRRQGGREHSKSVVRGVPALGAGSAGWGRRSPGKGRSIFPRPAAKYQKVQAGLRVANCSVY